MHIDIVIDLGFGDAGKGVVTDNLCNPDSLVVRFSGGHNAGHTVIRDGIKHVFSSFGAGSLQGCPSFFSRHTCVFPYAIRQEKLVLNKFNKHPKLYIDPNALVTIPEDILINRIREKLRGNNAHGSCGVGINETIQRCAAGFVTKAAHLMSPKLFWHKLRAIQGYYVEQ
jgi:adenylosuccinate synthase